MRRLVIIAAPLAGTFYEAAHPGEAPFVRVGQEVAPGDVVCLVESMKMFVEVFAERAGTVHRVVAVNDTFVAADQPLIELTAAD